MFSMCSKAAPQTPSNLHHHGPVGKQIKGGYLLRYKRQLLWNRWSEEWVVLYDDSTMAWFTEPGRSAPTGKILVKEAPEMLAIAQWTGQIPKRPPLPDGCHISQLIALGSRRKKSKVYWMLARSEAEVNDWINAISKTLPPPPQIELIIDKSHITGMLRRPLVRIRPATNTEVSARRNNHDAVRGTRINCDAAVAVLSKSTQDSDAKATLACVLPWGHGYGYGILPNGIWSGGLTWTQFEDTFTLHALPTTHCTNLIEASDAGVYHTDIGAFDFHAGGIDDIAGGEDFDYAMDCGDFIF